MVVNLVILNICDQNEDGVLTTDDKVFQGYKTPRIRWSFEK